MGHLRCMPLVRQIGERMPLILALKPKSALGDTLDIIENAAVRPLVHLISLSPRRRDSGQSFAASSSSASDLH